MKLAMVSPWPPAATGVAEYSAVVADELEAHYSVARLERCEPAALERADQRLYQLGNNILHAEAYRSALAVPGVAELHDGVLHHFYLGFLGQAEYLAEFAFNVGEDSRGVAEELWLAGSGAASDERFFRYPLLRRVVEGSRVVVVHNPRALAWVMEAKERFGAAAAAIEIPHYVPEARKFAAADLEHTRSRFGIPPGRLVIGCFGHQRPAKRLRPVLEASARLEADHCLLVVGDFVDRDYENSLAGLLARPRVVRIPAVSDEDLWRLAALTDVCVNLRWPSVGETSGIAMKLMSLGKCVVATDGAEWARFPRAALARVDAGTVESEMLLAYLRALAGNREMRLGIGAAAAQHVRENHSLNEVIRRYREVFEQAASM